MNWPHHKKIKKVIVKVTLGVLALATITACASADERDDFQEVRDSARTRLGADVAWSTNSDEDRAIAERVELLLAQPLDGNRALQVALLNNPALQESYAQIGVARAELAQAGLLENPVLSVGVGFPVNRSGAAQLDLSLVQNLVGVLLRPTRERMAADELEVARLRVAGEVQRFARDFRVAYIHWQARKQIVELRRLQSDASRAALSFAERLHAAGNISDLDLAIEADAHATMHAALRQAEAETAGDRETLSRLMGFAESKLNWSASDELPPIAADSAIDAGALENRALGQRFDLAAARRDLANIKSAIATSEKYPFYSFEAGLSAGRESDGLTLLGPEISIDLPFFDRRQAQIEKLKAVRRQLEQRVRVLTLETRSEVRAATLSFNAARERANLYRTQVIPERERTVALLQERYNAMLSGVFELLRAKQNETEAYSDYVEAVRDYWIADAELEYQLGGRIVAEPGENGVDAAGQTRSSAKDQEK